MLPWKKPNQAVTQNLQKPSVLWCLRKLILCHCLSSVQKNYKSMASCNICLIQYVYDGEFLMPLDALMLFRGETWIISTGW